MSSSKFWYLGEIRPVANPDRRKKFWKYFQKMWVTSTLGAFFAALARNLPVSLKEFNWHFNAAHTIDVFIRYSFLVWLLVYFFFSAFNDHVSEEISKKTLSFHIFQSAFSLGAAFFLGFLSPNAASNLAPVDLAALARSPLGSGYGWPAFLGAQGVICCICVLAYCLFRSDDSTNNAAFNRLRIYGAVATFLPLIVLLFSTAELIVRSLAAVSLLALWWILGVYIRLCYE